MTGGTLSAFVFYAILVAFSVGTVSEVIGDLQRAAGAVERLLELLSAQPDIDVPARPAALPSPTVGRAEFAAVTFRYPARPDHAPRAALERASLGRSPRHRPSSGHGTESRPDRRPR